MLVHKWLSKENVLIYLPPGVVALPAARDAGVFAADPFTDCAAVLSVAVQLAQLALLRVSESTDGFSATGASAGECSSSGHGRSPTGEVRDDKENILSSSS
jgi:hypothetical protein